MCSTHTSRRFPVSIYVSVEQGGDVAIRGTYRTQNGPTDTTDGVKGNGIRNLGRAIYLHQGGAADAYGGTSDQATDETEYQYCRNILGEGCPDVYDAEC